MSLDQSPGYQMLGKTGRGRDGTLGLDPPDPTMQRSAPTLAPALILSAAAALVACGEGELPLQKVLDGKAEITSSGVLVIVADGLRWDHTSLAGYDRETTPYLEQFAREAMVFSNAWSSSPSLVGSHVAILSGCDPSLAQPPDMRAALAPGSSAKPGVKPTDEDAWFVPEDLWLLGRPFLGAGWTTAAFVDHPMIAELRGFDRGFREFEEFRPDQVRRGSPPGVFRVGVQFVYWLRALPLDRNWFAYVHMNDLERAWSSARAPAARIQRDEGAKGWRGRQELGFWPPLGLTEPLFHALPPSRANRAQPITLARYELRYDQAIRALDHSLGRLISTVEEYGRGDDMTIVIMGSFGTGLGEHGLYLQAGLAEDEDLHVPLLIRPSKALRTSLGWSELEEGDWRTSDALVGLIDVAPTITDLAGVQQRERVHGVSLRPLLDGSEPAVRERVFARSSVLPGFAVIEDGENVAVYDSSLAPPAVADSWARGPGPGLEHLEGTPFMGYWRRWEGLLRLERLALHFGVESSDRATTEEFRKLQGASVPTDGTPKEDPKAEGTARSDG